jgi:hypothetical protein
MRIAVVGQETGAHYGEMMARYLGPVIARAFADDGARHPPAAVDRLVAKMSPVARPGVKWRQPVVSSALRLLPKPRAEKDRHGLGNPPFPSNPVPHRPRGDSQLSGSAYLGEAEPLQGGAQLLGGHRHGGLKIGTICPCWASRHIVPTFWGWLVVLTGPLPHTSAQRYTCYVSSTISCIMAASAGETGSSSFACSRPHGVSSGLPWSRSSGSPVAPEVGRYDLGRAGDLADARSDPDLLRSVGSGSNDHALLLLGARDVAVTQPLFVSRSLLIRGPRVAR